jgi:hypothetical protein
MKRGNKSCKYLREELSKQKPRLWAGDIPAIFKNPKQVCLDAVKFTEMK